MMATLFLCLVVLDFFGYLTNPYVGLVLFVAIPATFVVGLLLIPVGAWWNARRRLSGTGGGSDWPVIDLRNPRQRTTVVAVLVLTTSEERR
jgi:hypothetical protein